MSTHKYYVCFFIYSYSLYIFFLILWSTVFCLQRVGFIKFLKKIHAEGGRALIVGSWKNLHPVGGTWERDYNVDFPGTSALILAPVELLTLLWTASSSGKLRPGVDLSWFCVFCGTDAQQSAAAVGAQFAGCARLAQTPILLQSQDSALLPELLFML